jgi:hypothetical protein
VHPPADAVVDTLGRTGSGPLPRGELFIGADFLAHFFPAFQNDRVGGLMAAADALGLSLVGIDLEDEGSRNLLRAGKYRALEPYFVVGYLSGPVARLIAHAGFFNAMVALKKEHALVARMAEAAVRDAEKAVKTAQANGMRAIAVADDIAGNEGLFFSFDYFAAVLLPVYRTIAATVKANNRYAFFHSDGNMRKAIGPLAESGYDCIHPVDLRAGMDLYALAETYGTRTSFMGHIDTMGWGRQRVEAEVRRAEARFRPGGVILGSSGGVSLEMIREGFHALYPHWHERGPHT